MQFKFNRSEERCEKDERNGTGTLSHSTDDDNSFGDDDMMIHSCKNRAHKKNEGYTLKNVQK